MLLSWLKTLKKLENCLSSPASGLEMSTAMTRCAPSFCATPTGRLAAAPPSTSLRPSSSTGGNAPGIDMLARIAVASDPSPITTASPVAMSIATARYGIGRRSKSVSPVVCISSARSSSSRLCPPSTPGGMYGLSPLKRSFVGIICGRSSWRRRNALSRRRRPSENTEFQSTDLSSASISSGDQPAA